MRALCLLFVMSAACAKKPAPKAPSPPPPSEETQQPEPPKDGATPNAAPADPCEGGQ